MAQTLLLADDSVTIQRVIELTFADENIDVVAVGDGDEAIARIDANPPDIVLADVGMPGRDGYEVAAHVKGTPQLAHIPVVLLTGAFEPVDQERAAQVGSDGVLAKPFEPQMVIARVRELLAAPQVSAAVESDAAAGAAEPAAPEAASAPADAQATARHDASLDEYFDRLDAAVATFSHPAPPASSTAPAATQAGPDIDWFGHAHTPGADLPLSYASPAPPIAPAAAPAPETTAAPGAVASLPSVPATAVPSLADAFAAILAAEQSEAAVPASWPAAPAPQVGDDLVEIVTRRVLERMSDQAVRETVGGIVSATAERLVREEIERIKSAIK